MNFLIFVGRNLHDLRYKTHLLVSILTIAMLIPAKGQLEDIPCATSPGEFSTFSKEYHEGSYKDHARSGNELIYLPVTLHLVGRNDGSGHYPRERALESFCRLNEDFAPYNIQFYFKSDIKTINRTLFYEHDNFDEGRRQMRSYKDPLTINTFVTSSAPDNACGYWSGTEDAIVVIKNCMGGNAHTWTHEVGHWLDLPHTFDGWEGRTYDPEKETPTILGIRGGTDTIFVETASGDNCGKAGDRFCDTPADYLSRGWSCDGNFKSNVIQKDPMGVDFRSDGSNYMSYSVDACQSKFSTEQVDFMHSFTRAIKSHFISDAIPSGDIPHDPVVAVHPLENEKVHYEDIELEWKHHVNANRYLVQISKFSFFATIDYEFVVSGTNKINIGDLEVDRKWYWRVKPYNAYYTCAPFTDEGGFETYDITDIDEINDRNKLEIYPTLLSGLERQLYLDFDFSDLMTAEVGIWDISGQRLVKRRFENPSGNLETLDLQGLSPGMYLLRISTPKGAILKRITIQ